MRKSVLNSPVLRVGEKKDEHKLLGGRKLLRASDVSRVDPAVVSQEK